MEADTDTASRTHGRTDSISEQITDEEEDELLDPRIQRELDQLNNASADINQLENELDEARTKYRSIVSDTSNRMEAIAQDQKRCIRKSREYYKLVNEAKLAQSEALKAARQFQSATGVYTVAKETVALAERSLREETAAASAAQLTSAWQEMLSNAVSKVTEAEKEKRRCETEHGRRAARFAELENRKQLLEKKFSRAIRKAKPYFDLKAQLDIRLMQQKQNVTDLQAAIKASKVKYTAALRRLEKISEEIHQSRSEKLWSQVPRMPGVGAETGSITSGLSELALDVFDLKDDTDTASGDGESMRDFCGEGIDVIVGADDDTHTGVAETVVPVTGVTDSVETQSDDTESIKSVTNTTVSSAKPDGSNDAPIAVGNTKADTSGAKGLYNTDLRNAADSKVVDAVDAGDIRDKEDGADSEEEVFEDAETGHDHDNETNGDEDRQESEQSHGHSLNVYAGHERNVNSTIHVIESIKGSAITESSIGRNEHSETSAMQNEHSVRPRGANGALVGTHKPTTQTDNMLSASASRSHDPVYDTNVNRSRDPAVGGTTDHVAGTPGDVSYAEMNMREVERPSLSGEEE